MQHLTPRQPLTDTHTHIALWYITWGLVRDLKIKKKRSQLLSLTPDCHPGLQKIRKERISEFVLLLGYKKKRSHLQNLSLGKHWGNLRVVDCCQSSARNLKIEKDPLLVFYMEKRQSKVANRVSKLRN